MGRITESDIIHFCPPETVAQPFVATGQPGIVNTLKFWEELKFPNNYMHQIAHPETEACVAIQNGDC